MGAVLVEAHRAAVGIARVDLSFEVHCNAFRSDAGAIGKALDIAQLVIVWIRIGGRRGGRLPDDRFKRYRPEQQIRSEERRVGKEGVSTFKSRWSPYH